MKKLKIKIKGWLLVKIAKYRKQIKLLEKKIIEIIEKEQDYIDKITLLENDIRELTLKLTTEQRAEYLKLKNKKGGKK